MDLTQLEDIIAIIVGGAILWTPIFGLTVRFALKPVAEKLGDILERRWSDDGFERRLQAIEQEVRSLNEATRDLLEAQPRRTSLPASPEPSGAIREDAHA